MRLERASQGKLVIDGVVHGISMGKIITSPTGEYTTHLYGFTDEFGGLADGALFKIEPYCSSGIMRTTDSKLHTQRIVVSGSGWFLGISPEGQVVVHELNADNEENPLIVLNQGWVDCFIAGENGMEVADLSMPPFQPEMEEEVLLTSLPSEFVKKYNELRKFSL